jgi:IclR family transcriptional regulator, mhp operon transcriptional activator
VRHDGYAIRDPRTKPLRTTTLAVPIREGEAVQALVSISIFTTAVPREKVVAEIVVPLQETIARIEQALAFTHTGAHFPVANALEHEGAAF